MPKNPVLLEYENNQIRATDLSSLNPTGWLTEATEFSNDDILFLGAYTTYRLCHSKDSSIAINLFDHLEKDLTSKSIVLAPLNNRNHWSLLVYSRLNCTYYYYDSISRHNTDFALQANHDCGIYVLAIAEELSRRFVNFRKSSSTNLKFISPYSKSITFVDSYHNNKLNNYSSGIYQSAFDSGAATRCSPFPRNFWRVMEEDIEYPKTMRTRIRSLVISLL
ncbi:hypothetical protein BB560_003343 [Smittium megazygosporum]|uniref:Ubiquitin-like protease family profile domain-containing protein n=1 Tax=Smittium megazygosporum TaxID=133381 RepID=A0A2T9ZCA1_9FUNG|nr:hypothetical protein BB560_003343 [Smittium megazygosporum]